LPFIYEKQIVELVRQQPTQEQERTNKENDFNLKSKENQIKQQEINQLNAQLDSMNRSALQEKKSTLETIKENLQKAQNALIVLEDKKLIKMYSVNFDGCKNNYDKRVE